MIQACKLANTLSNMVYLAHSNDHTFPIGLFRVKVQPLQCERVGGEEDLVMTVAVVFSLTVNCERVCVCVCVCTVTAIVATTSQSKVESSLAHRL